MDIEKILALIASIEEELENIDWSGSTLFSFSEDAGDNADNAGMAIDDAIVNINLALDQIKKLIQPQSDVPTQEE